MGKLGWCMSKTKTATYPPCEGDPVGTRQRERERERERDRERQRETERENYLEVLDQSAGNHLPVLVFVVGCAWLVGASLLGS